MRYKRHKHEYLRDRVQECRCDLAVLRFQLADIGADLYGWKIETAAAYEGARLRREEEVETALNELKKKDNKITNVADRAKRTAKLETSAEEMIRADKMNRLAVNLYQYAIPDVLHAMSSRLASFDRPTESPKHDNRPQEEPADSWFSDEWDREERRVIDGVSDLESEM